MYDGKSKKTDILSEAIKLYKSGQIGTLVEFLEDNLETDNKDLLLNKIYAFSLIRANNFKEAKYILEKMLDIYPEDYEILNALAFVSAFGGYKTESINYLLDAEYFAPQELKGKIKSNLDLVSNLSDVRLILNYVKPQDFLILNLPEVKKKNLKFGILRERLNLKTIIMVLGIFLIGLLFYFAISSIIGIFDYSSGDVASNIKKRVERITIENDLELSMPAVVVTNEIILNGNQIVSIFNEIKSLISRNRFSNRARFLVNYLLNSNAPISIKNKTQILKTFLEPPTPGNIDWVPLFEEVSSKQFLYDDVFVMWRGKIVNIQGVGSKVNFTFVVEGDNPSVVKGFIKGSMENFPKGYEGSSVNVFGRLFFDSELFDSELKIEALNIIQ